MSRFLLGVSLVCGLASSTFAADAKSVTVPFIQLPSGHITVQVKIDDKGPYQLIFDTGAPITLLNNRIAKDSGITKGINAPFFAPFGALGEVKIKKLQVGNQVAEDVSAMIMDHPTVGLFNDAFASKFGKIDGLVGFPFFARFKMTIDYKEKTLTFEPNGFKPPDVIKAVEAMMTDAILGGNSAPKVLSPAGQWGLTVRKAKDDEEAGMPVTEVLDGSPAAAAGIKKGDRLLTVDGRWTDSLGDTYTAAGFVKPGSTVNVVVQRDGKEIKIKMKPLAGL